LCFPDLFLMASIVFEIKLKFLHASSQHQRQKNTHGFVWAELTAPALKNQQRFHLTSIFTSN